MNAFAFKTRFDADFSRVFGTPNRDPLTGDEERAARILADLTPPGVAIASAEAVLQGAGFPFGSIRTMRVLERACELRRSR